MAQSDLIPFRVLPPLCENAIDNHAELAVKRIISQYKDKPNVKALVESLGANQIQQLEYALCGLHNRYNIDASEGSQLDLIGEILGVNRSGRGDDLYRIVLKVKAGVNNSDGTIEDIISIWSLVTGATDIEVRELGNATIEIESNARLIQGLDTTVRDLFKGVVAGGVKINAKFYPEFPFQFEDFPDDPNAGGFGDVNDSAVGGNLAGIIV
jgi:hypothetical protein